MSKFKRLMENESLCAQGKVSRRSARRPFRLQGGPLFGEQVEMTSSILRSFLLECAKRIALLLSSGDLIDLSRCSLFTLECTAPRMMEQLTLEKACFCMVFVAKRHLFVWQPTLGAPRHCLGKFHCRDMRFHVQPLGASDRSGYRWAMALTC